jgi:hypothetical protein
MVGYRHLHTASQVAPAAADSDGAAQRITFPSRGDPAFLAATRSQRIA